MSYRIIAKHKRNKGFTLIELLVVIAILGLISSIILISLRGVRAKANDAKRINDGRAILNALELYNVDNGKYPCHTPQKSAAFDFLSILNNSDYLALVPNDPVNSGNHVYQYRTYKETPTGPCGQIVEFNIDLQNSSDQCPFSGKKVGDAHCHIFIPRPLPCDDPWISDNNLGDDEDGDPTNNCEPLADIAAENDY